MELAGHDYVMDLIADLELPPNFPKQKSYFIISTDDPAKVRANASLLVHKHTNTNTNIRNDRRHKSSSSLSALFGSGFDSDEELPPAFPLSCCSSRPAYSLPDSDGYYSHGTQSPKLYHGHLCIENSRLHHNSAVLLHPVESDAFSDGQAQRGMDRYLDSLFDPVLSDSSIVSTDMNHMFNILSLLLWIFKIQDLFLIYFSYCQFSMYL